MATPLPGPRLKPQNSVRLPVVPSTRRTTTASRSRSATKAVREGSRAGDERASSPSRIGQHRDVRIREQAVAPRGRAERECLRARRARVRGAHYQTRRSSATQEGEAGPRCVHNGRGGVAASRPLVGSRCENDRDEPAPMLVKLTQSADPHRRSAATARGKSACSSGRVPPTCRALQISESGLRGGRRPWAKGRHRRSPSLVRGAGPEDATTTRTAERRMTEGRFEKRCWLAAAQRDSSSSSTAGSATTSAYRTRPSRMRSCHLDPSRSWKEGASGV